MNFSPDEIAAIERARLASRRFVVEWQDAAGAWHRVGHAEDAFAAIGLAIPYAQHPFRIIDGMDGQLLPITIRQGAR